MKTIIWKIWMLMLALGLLTATACSDDSNNDNNPIGDPNGDELYEYGIKSGQISYRYIDANPGDTPDTSYTKLIFDNNGKQQRIEMYESDGSSAVGIVIIDEISGKLYSLLPSLKQYTEESIAGASAYRLLYVYYGDDVSSAWSYFPGFSKKSNKTIAGKDCTVYGWNITSENTTFEWGGWKRITFWMYENSTAGGTTTMEAKSFSESIPANSFSVPSDYTEISSGQP